MTKSLLILAWMAAPPTAAFAQAAIAGSVKDPSGAPLPGVTVEASSPALIEKIRTAVTDGTGRYRIEDLRPGIYAVTFTLQGWSPYRREGVELTGSFTATVNAELAVGPLTEPSPSPVRSRVVDVHSAKREVTLSGERRQVDSHGSQLQRAARCSCPGVVTNVNDTRHGHGDDVIPDSRRPDERGAPLRSTG